MGDIEFIVEEQAVVNTIKGTDPFFLKEAIAQGFVKTGGGDIRFCVLTNFELKLYRVLALGKNVRVQGRTRKAPTFVSEMIDLPSIKLVERIEDSGFRVQFTGGVLELYVLQKDGRERWVTTIQSLTESMIT